MGVSLLVRVLAAAYLATMMFSIGLIVGGQPKVAKPVRRHERRLLVRVLLVQLVGLPLIAWGILRLLNAHGDVAAAILVLSVAPGGRLLPNLARRAHGDLGLAVEVTLWLAKLTAFVAPPMLALLGDVHRVELDDVRIIGTLIGVQLLPFFAGRALRRRRASVAAQLRHPLDVARGALVVAVLAVVIAQGSLTRLHFVGEVGWAAAFIFAAISSRRWLAGRRPLAADAAHLRAGGERARSGAGVDAGQPRLPGPSHRAAGVRGVAHRDRLELLFAELFGRPHRAGEEVLA